MANTFRVVTFAAEPASAGTAYTMYTVPSSPATTTVLIGLRLANISGSTVTAEVELVSDTATGVNAGAAATNGTAFLIKDAPIPAGGALDVLGTSKVILQATDVIKVDCSVADQLSGTLSIMEIT
tara:strand:- start:353 stop:727 length:375 start_codon:yes stop_codon:yes gene_type:complete